MAYENNHYIPQFVLRQFGERINVYNVKDGSLLSGQRTDHIFSERKIYPADLEQDIGYKLEAPFAKLFHNKLMNGNCGDKIVLTRKELQLMKRFFLLETLRVVSMEALIGAERQFSDLHAAMFPNFKEKTIPDETPTDRWHRNLRVIVEAENLLKVSEHPLCTCDVLRWSYIFNSGYFAIWDCSASDTDFLISDIGMTSEVEPSKLKDGFEHTKKDTLCELLNRERNAYKKEAYQNLLSAQIQFHENFYMFPLSKSRMIVSVNPFFSLYDNKTKLTKPYGVWPTLIKERRLFEKNVSLKLMTIMGKPLYRDDDEFTYTVQRVNNEDAEYINMLMLDRVDCYMGYADWSRIESSVRRYIVFHKEIGIKAPVDYEPLVKSIKNDIS